MSSTSDVRLTRDRTGFPFLSMGLASVSLLPVTWLQMERRLSEPGGRSSIWYDSLFEPASGRKRGSWQSFRDEDREDIFVSGVTSEEAVEYVQWLKGKSGGAYDFDLPQADLWRDAAAWMQERPFDAEAQQLLDDSDMAPAARRILERLIAAIRPQTWADLALFRNGLFEWVRDHKGAFGGLGAPRITRLRHTFNPFDRRAVPVRSMAAGRPQWFGIRPIVFGDELVT